MNLLKSMFLDFDLPDDPGWPHFARRILGVTLAFSILVACFSVGFLHFDEHFQILEFATFKLGQAPASDLAWEYRAQIRPWLQPFLTTGIIKFFQTVGVSNPFTMATLLRIVSACFAWFGTVSLVRIIPHFVATALARRWACAGLCFFYYSFLIHARTSSENYAATAFALGLSALVVSLSNKDEVANEKQSVSTAAAAFAGIAFCAAFQFRYQIAFMVVGALLWFCTYARVSLRAIQAYFASFIVFSLFSICIDWWGYGSWTYAPWNYLKSNLLEGVASRFGVNPWYDYLRMLISDIRFPLGALVLIGFFAAVLKNPRHLLVWCAVPFVVVHSLIAHKEFRFLIPFLNFAPILVVVGLFPFLETRKWFTSRGAVYKLLVFVLVGANFIYFFRYALRPQTPMLLAAEKIYKLTHEGGVLVWQNENPFVSAGGLIMNFYKPRRLHIVGTREMQSGTFPTQFAFYQQGKRGAGVAPPLPACRIYWSDAFPQWLPAGLQKNSFILKFLSKPVYQEIYTCTR